MQALLLLWLTTVEQPSRSCVLCVRVCLGSGVHDPDAAAADVTGTHQQQWQQHRSSSSTLAVCSVGVLQSQQLPLLNMRATFAYSKWRQAAVAATACWWPKWIWLTSYDVPQQRTDLAVKPGQRVDRQHSKQDERECKHEHGAMANVHTPLIYPGIVNHYVLWPRACVLVGLIQGCMSQQELIWQRYNLHEWTGETCKQMCAGGDIYKCAT